MIIYLFDEEIHIKLNLPVKVSGEYPINNDERFIANISSINDKWGVRLASEYFSDDLQSTNNELIAYKIYKIKSAIDNKTFHLVSVPKYDPNEFEYNIANGISIGNNANCDICYAHNSVEGQEYLKLTPYNQFGAMTVETNSTNFFVSDNRAVSGTLAMSGDYIFFNGLRVILFGNKIIINNPNNLVKVKAGNVQACEINPNFQVPQVINTALKADTPLFSKDDYFFKSPRFNYVVEEESVEIEAPPAPEPENDLPAIVVIGPQLTMVSTSILSMVNYLNSYLTGTTTPFRFFISIGIMGITITGTLLWPSITRRFNKKRILKKEQKRQEKYRKYLEAKSRQIEMIKQNQKQATINNHPSVEQCIKIISNKTKDLWQRSIDHEDFLSIRLGVGSVPTKLDMTIPKEQFSIEDEDKLFTELKKIADNALTISEVPISYTFTQQRVNAIVGQPKLIKEFMDCVFLQMMTFHSYTDLKIVIFTKEPNKWDYLRIIPHCWDNQKSIRYFTTNVEELSAIASELEKTFDARVADSDEVKLEDDGDEDVSKKDFSDFRPYYLFFVDDTTSVRNISLISKILHYKRNMGFSIIVTSESISTLPSETEDFIVIEKTESAIMTSQMTNRHNKFKADFNEYNAIDVYQYSQILANIPILAEKAKYELPSSLSFLELYNLGKVEQLNSLSRWSDNNPVISLAVPIGIDQSGEIFKMDIHEKAYGPHGLVAGTTGSGKSEWIVTYILSLAVNFSPDEVQFVLIDYKGGGLALSFENQELGIKLPHLAGTITNLDKSEIFRSIAAIESELKRRQSIFNQAREKLKEGSMNIYKYQQFYRKGMVDEPLSHLLIICDEFAELKQQQSEFMDQLISTSRIGRSLGIHLILATQKPSGVVNDQIWSNSKFKVCLKVQDKGDSKEILKKPDAAFLKQTGAFYLQVGNDDYYNLGQAAWAGAKYYPSEVIKHKIDESIQYIDNIGRTVGFYEDVEEETRESKGEELINIVGYISEISKKTPIKSKPLWLENIKTEIYISELFQRYNRQKQNPYTYSVAIGEYDEPREQKQDLLQIDLSEGNVAIIGQNGSGKDTLVSTIIWSSIVEHTPYELAYYIIDFGSETLKKFAKFPHVGEVVFQDETDKVAGILDLVIEEFERRKDVLSDYNGSFEYYNRVQEEKLPLIVTVINSFDIFSESFPKLNDLITNLFRDAAKYGLVFVVSVSSPTALRQRQLQFFNHTILMQLNDDGQYRTITNCRRGLIPKKTLGRGICKTNPLETDSYCEFQTAFIAEEEKELEIIKDFADKCVDFYKYKVKELAKIPDDVSSADLMKMLTTLTDVPIGYNFYEKEVAKYNFLSSKIHVITGKNIKENMEFIYGISSLLSKIPNVKLRVVDMMDLFKQPILDIKLFNEEIDVVFGAIEKDILTRTEAQDYAINIILGAGQYKRKLSKGGVEIFKNIFDNIPNSKKSIFILIDDYDKIRTIKLESWFEQVDPSTGIWVGPGFANQSFFTSKEVSAEDKKYDYEGLAYNINKGDYKVIKTVMDGEG